MAESPFNRPVAADLIGDTIAEIQRLRREEPFLCGYTEEMQIYVALKRAGYLTDAAQVPSEYDGRNVVK